MQIPLYMRMGHKRRKRGSSGQGRDRCCNPEAHWRSLDSSGGTGDWGRHDYIWVMFWGIELTGLNNRLDATKREMELPRQ